MMSGLVIIVCAQGELQICWLPAYRISWCKRWVGGNRKPIRFIFAMTERWRRRRLRGLTKSRAVWFGERVNMELGGG